MLSFFLSEKRKTPILLITVACFLAATILLPFSQCRAFTLSEEQELGRKILEQVRRQMSLVEDGEIITYVQSVGNRIVKQLGTTSYQYQFFVIDEAVPNAFAVPGGYIFIHRGLIELMKSEGELAGTISHELAHVQAHHIERNMKEGTLLTIATLAGILAGVLVGGKTDASPALMMGSIAGAQSAQLKFSRENEEEADQLGFRYLCAAGYPPEAMVSVMQRLNQAKWLSNSRVPSYLLTHPALSERIQYLGDLVQKQKGVPGKTCTPIKNQGDFPIMQAALVAEYSDPQMAEERFQAAIRQGDAVGEYGLGRLYLRQGKPAEALPHLQAAARKEAASPFILSTLGAAYYRQGNLSEARKVLQSALVLDPSASVVHYRLALALQEMGLKEEALQHLQQIEGFSPSFPDIDYRLGVVLGQINRVGLAHYYLGRFYEHKQDWKLAFFHYNKAKDLLQDAPQKREEAKQRLKEVEKKKKDAYWEKLRNGP